MLRKSFLFCLALVAAIASTIKSQSVESDSGTRKIRDPCTRDIQCIKNAFCKNQQYCLCETYYAPSLDLLRCHVTLGAPCGSKYHGECESMANAECRQNVCTCKDDFMIDVNNSSNCVTRPKAPGDACYRTEDCRDSMELSSCIDNKCSCYADHHFVNETGTCLKKRGLYMPCKKDYECFVDANRPKEMECKNGECACREGEPSCNKGAVSHQAVFLAVAMAIFGTTYRNQPRLGEII